MQTYTTQQHIVSPSSPSNRLPGLDFLRAFAALWVFLFHYVELAPAELKPALQSAYVTIGWSGVDLFFVLSGFLIGGILCRENEHAGSFVIRRVFRIYPAYLLTVFVCIAINKPYLFDNTLLVISHIFLFNNLIPGYGGAVNGVLWTLGAEFQFYMIATLILFLPRQKKYFWPYLIVAIVVFSLIYRWIVFESVTTAADRFFYVTQLPGMLGLFGMGFLAVQLQRRIATHITNYFPLYFALSIGLLFFYCNWLRQHIGDYWDNRSVVLGGRFFSGIVFAYLVLVFACIPGSLGTLFKKSGLVFIGEISYGIYLTHLFFIDWLRPHEAFFMQFDWKFYAATLVVLTFVASSLIYFLVEQPFIKMGTRLSINIRNRK